MNKNEFESNKSLVHVLFIVARYELLSHLPRFLFRKVLNKRPVRQLVRKKPRFNNWQAKRLVILERLAATNTNNNPSWFYSAFERRYTDPLTEFSFSFIFENIDKESKVLVTGCGTGITAFRLADHGFTQVEGRDLLPEAIRVANRIKDSFGYSSGTFVVDDCLKPSLESSYRLITMMHWVFSAWMGSYGNTQTSDPFDDEVRESCLGDLFDSYVPFLDEGGYIIIELTDAVADYRDPFDHPSGFDSVGIYPVRFTTAQVGRCANQFGLEIIDRKLCVNYGHQPRTTYILRKVG